MLHSAPPGAALFAEIGGGDLARFVHDPGPISDRYFFPQIMGSGCALIDFDRDGDLDLLLIDGHSSEESGEIDSTPQKGNRLLRNDGHGSFVDVSRESGLDGRMIGTGAAVGDVNNDGFPDLYLSAFGGDRLFLNQRDGTFRDVTAEAGLESARWGTSCAFFDYDRDGRLDLFVANYVDYHASVRCVGPNGLPDYCNPKILPAVPARLYHNETGSSTDDHEPRAASTQESNVIRFRDVSLESKIALLPGPGLGVLCADFNGDRWPDVFVANDGAANFLWINQRDGTFREEALAWGLAFDSLGRPQANMGIAWGDADGDGNGDLCVTHLGGEGAALYLRREPRAFEEAAARWGVREPTFPFTGFGTAFLDINHDGWLDLAVVNGRVKRRDGAPAPAFDPDGRCRAPAEFWSAYAERNQLFLNAGGGRFEEVVVAEEPFTQGGAIARGLAVGDLDNDGDLDLVVTNTAGPARLFANVAPAKGNWLVIRPVEPALGGRDALGALVTVVAGNRRWQRLAHSAGSYLASSDPRVHFGLGDIAQVDRIEVVWPDGTEEVFPGGPVNRFMTIEHGTGRRD